MLEGRNDLWDNRGGRAWWQQSGLVPKSGRVFYLFCVNKHLLYWGWPVSVRFSCVDSPLLNSGRASYNWLIFNFSRWYHDVFKNLKINIGIFQVVVNSLAALAAIYSKSVSEYTQYCRWQLYTDWDWLSISWHNSWCQRTESHALLNLSSRIPWIN